MTDKKMDITYSGGRQTKGFIQIDAFATRKTQIIYADSTKEDADKLGGCRFSGVLIGEGVNLCDCEFLYKRILQRVIGDTEYPVAVLLNKPIMEAD